jgi:hypothetical protein
MLVTNTVDHHLYEWWITPQGQLTGIDLGAAWSNVQFLGNSHYNSASAYDELLVRNTVDGHFYEWWIVNNQLSGVDLGAAATSSSMTNAAVTSSAADPAPTSAANAAAAPGSGGSGGGVISMAGLGATAAVMEPALMGSDLMGSDSAVE